MVLARGRTRLRNELFPQCRIVCPLGPFLEEAIWVRFGVVKGSVHRMKEGMSSSVSWASGGAAER